jgi:hypothetical protein
MTGQRKFEQANACSHQPQCIIRIVGRVNGDTVVMVEDGVGLRIKTIDEVLVEARAYFAKLVPRGVLLSDEVNEDRAARSPAH